MENASKALLIAGAILIAILLISVGMMVMQSGQGIISGAEESMSAHEIELFNKEFENYIGKQKGSSVRGLMSKVKASNASHDEDHQVAVEFEGDADPDSISSTIRPASTYEVKITSDKTSALIKSITIEKTSGTSNNE